MALPFYLGKLETQVNAVDVIIPVYNAAKFVQKCILSVQQQTLPANKIIVIDDGSEDSTVQIVDRLVKADSRIELIQSDHQGVSHSRNLGIAASNAPFITILDVDDGLYPKKLARHLEAFETIDSKYGLVHSFYDFVDTQGLAVQVEFNGLRTQSPPSANGYILPQLLEPTCAVLMPMIKREVLDLAGYYDEQLFYGEDLDLWLRLANITQCFFIPESLGYICVNPVSAQHRSRGRKQQKFLFQKLRVLDRWYTHVDFPTKPVEKQCLDSIYNSISQDSQSNSIAAKELYQQLISGSIFLKNLYQSPAGLQFAVGKRRLTRIAARILRLFLPKSMYVWLKKIWG